MTAGERPDRPDRPDRLVLVAGTGTEVGKTWIAAHALAHLHERDVTVAARKPAQSFDPLDDEPTDADVLAAATGEQPATVCPSRRWYRTPMAPPMAASALGLPSFRIADLAGELRWPTPGVAVGVVESAGGVCSPLADDGDTVDLAVAVAPDLVVLVADAGLGTINGVRTSMAALDRRWIDLDRVVVVLNRFVEDDDLHRRNRSWLRDRCGYHVETSGAVLAGLWHPG